MAAPTKDSVFEPKVAIPAAMPDISAIITPIIKERNSQQASISFVTPSSPLIKRSSIHPITKPKTNPKVVAKITPINKFARLENRSDWSLITMPNVEATIHPIIGEINMLDTNNTVLFSMKPNAAKEL